MLIFALYRKAKHTTQESFPLYTYTLQEFQEKCDFPLLPQKLGLRELREKDNSLTSNVDFSFFTLLVAELPNCQPNDGTLFFFLAESLNITMVLIIKMLPIINPDSFFLWLIHILSLFHSFAPFPSPSFLAHCHLS